MTSQDINYNNIYSINKETKPYNREFFLDKFQSGKYQHNPVIFPKNTPIIFHTDDAQYNLGILHSIRSEVEEIDEINLNILNSMGRRNEWMNKTNHILLSVTIINLESKCLESEPKTIELKDKQFAYIGLNQITVKDNSFLTNVCRYFGIQSSRTRGVNNTFSQGIPVKTFINEVTERKRKNNKIRKAQTARRIRDRQRKEILNAAKKRKNKITKKKAANSKWVKNRQTNPLLPTAAEMYNKLKLNLNMSNNNYVQNNTEFKEHVNSNRKKSIERKAATKKRKRKNNNKSNSNNNSNYEYTSNSNNKNKYFGNLSRPYHDSRLSTGERNFKKRKMLESINFNEFEPMCELRVLQLETEIIRRINEIKRKKGDGYQLHSRSEYPKRIKTVGVINVSKFNNISNNEEPKYNNIIEGTDLLCLISLDDEENEINIIVNEYIKREATLLRHQSAITPEDQFKLLNKIVKDLLKLRKIGVRKYFGNKTLKANTWGPGRSLK